MTAKEAINRIMDHMRIHRIGEPPHIHIADALNMAIAALQDQEEREYPKQLTIEEMLNMDAPVWVSCFTLDGKHGYWCICREGIITCPSGVCYDVRDIPLWKFYRYQLKGK